MLNQRKKKERKNRRDILFSMEHAEKIIKKKPKRENKSRNLGPIFAPESRCKFKIFNDEIKSSRGGRKEKRLI